MLWRSPAGHEIDCLEEHSLGALIKKVARLPLEKMTLKKKSLMDWQCLSETAKTTLRSCESILSRWACYQRSGKWDTINNSEPPIAVQLPGPVILDATTFQNMLWELLSERVGRPLIPPKARNYSNVTLHVGHAEGLGKGSMKTKTDTGFLGSSKNWRKRAGRSQSFVLGL